MTDEIETRIRASLARKAGMIQASSGTLFESGQASRSHTTVARRLSVIVAALVIAGVGVLFVWLAINPSSEMRRPLATPDASAERVVGGEISAMLEAPATTDISAGPSGMWVAIPEQDYDVSCSGAIAQIDGTANTVGPPLALDATPTAIYSGAQYVWVGVRSCESSNAVSLLLVSPGQGIVDQIPVADSGSVADIAQSDGMLWLSVAGLTQEENSIVAIDEDERTIEFRVPVTGRIEDVQADETGAWVFDTQLNNSALIRIESEALTVLRYLEGEVSGRAGFTMAGDSDGVWVALDGGLDAAMVTPDGDVAVGPLPVPGGFGPFAGDGQGVWFWGLSSDGTTQTVAWLNAQTGSVEVEVPISDAPSAGILVEDTLWISLFGGDVVRVDLETTEAPSATGS